MIPKSFLILLIYPLSALSSVVICDYQTLYDNELKNKLTDIESMKLAVYALHMKYATCKNESHVLTDEGYFEYFKDKKKTKWKFSKTLYGVDFKQEDPKLLELFEKLTTPLKTKRSPDKLKVPSFKTKCTKVLCAVEEIFGKKIGIRQLYLMDKYSINTSHYAYQDKTYPTVKYPNKDLLDDIISVYADLPEEFVRLKPKNLRMTFSASQPKDEDGEARDKVNANSRITLFPNWAKGINETDKLERRRTIFHEFAHIISDVNEDYDPSLTDYDSSDEWENIHKNYTPVSIYARKNNNENFAESLTAYRYFPEKLKKVNPVAYQYVKFNIFSGKEFGTYNKCQKDSKLYQEILDKAKELQVKLRESKEHKSIEKKCLKEKKIENYNQCIKSYYVRRTIKDIHKIDQLPTSIPLYLIDKLTGIVDNQ